VQDICRLIRQEPKAALLIVQLLRRYQLERSGNNCITVTSSPPSALPPTPIPPSNIVPSSMNGQPALWNGFLSVPPPLKSIDCPKHHRPLPIGESNGLITKAGRKRCCGTLMKDDGTRRHGETMMAPTNGPPPMGRSNSVLDGMTTAKCGGGGGQNCAIRCGCRPLNATMVRRPRSSLGGITEFNEGEATHFVANTSVDMEEIFRSVLQGEEAGGDCRMDPEAMESPQKVGQWAIFKFF
jgi:hypothetical protein